METSQAAASEQARSKEAEAKREAARKRKLKLKGRFQQQQLQFLSRTTDATVTFEVPSSSAMEHSSDFQTGTCIFCSGIWL